MARNLTPELLIARFFKSATRGRQLSGKLRRILTTILIPMWTILSVVCFIKSYDEIQHNFTEDIYLPFFRIDERWSFPLFILFAFIVPYLTLWLIFWIMDADKIRTKS